MYRSYPHFRFGTCGSKSDFTPAFPSPIGDFALQGTKPSTGVFLCTSKTPYTLSPPLSWRGLLFLLPSVLNPYHPRQKSISLSNSHPYHSKPLSIPKGGLVKLISALRCPLISLVGILGLINERGLHD